LKLLDYLLVILAVTFNFEIYAWFNISTNGITTNDLITLAMTIILLKAAIWDGREFHFAKNPVVQIYFIFMLSTLISGFLPMLSGKGYLISQYFKTLAHFYFTSLIIIVLIFYKFNANTWDYFIKAWLLFSIFINIFGVYQIIARALDLPFAWIELTSASFYSRTNTPVDDMTQLSLQFEGFFRATSIFSEPSSLGAFNGLSLSFLIVPRIKGFPNFIRSKALHNTILVLCIIGLMLAFSMTGVTIVILTFFTVFLTERLNVFGNILKILPFVIILLYFADLAVEHYAGISVIEMFGKRFGSIANVLAGSSDYGTSIAGESAMERGENFEAMFNIFQSSPLIGIGLGLTYYSPLSDGWRFSDTSFMGIMAELGLVGAVPFIALFLSIYIISFRITRSKNIVDKIPMQNLRHLSLIVYILAYLIVVNFISGNNYNNIGTLLFLGYIFSNLNNYYIDIQKNYYKIRFVRTPLSKLFSKNTAYLKLANKSNKQTLTQNIE